MLALHLTCRRMQRTTLLLSTSALSTAANSTGRSKSRMSPMAVRSSLLLTEPPRLTSGLMIVPSRFYANEKSIPSPPNLPDKQQMEKYFFRVVAFLWDTSLWLYAWSMRNLQQHVVNNSTVQMYYKKFLAKMEQSKKN